VVRGVLGDMFTIDNPLTEGPNAAPHAMGRAHGFYLFVSQTELAPLLYVNMVLMIGHHKWCMIAMLARDLILHKVRVMEFPSSVALCHAPDENEMDVWNRREVEIRNQHRTWRRSKNNIEVVQSLEF
jgi:hypothetical protein